MSDLLQQAAENVQARMDEILTNFKTGAKITVLVRTVGKPTADFCMTNDDLSEVLAMVHRRKGEAARTPSNQGEIERLTAENVELRWKLGAAEVFETMFKNQRDELLLAPTPQIQVRGIVAAFEATYPELYYHIAKGKICAGEPLYGAIITTMGATEIGHGESDISADDALRIAIENAGLTVPALNTKGNVNGNGAGSKAETPATCCPSDPNHVPNNENIQPPQMLLGAPQDIRTAPSMTDVLVWWPIVKLDEYGDPTDEVVDGCWIISEDQGGHWIEPEVMNAIGDHMGDEHTYADKPSHWTPLPARLFTATTQGSIDD
jgi:hypothetical protein